MKIRTSIGTGVAAAISATLLTFSSAPASAARPDAWDVCPAIDTEPLCNLVRHHRPASDRPAAAASASSVLGIRSSEWSRAPVDCLVDPGLNQNALPPGRQDDGASWSLRNRVVRRRPAHRPCRRRRLRGLTRGGNCCCSCRASVSRRHLPVRQCAVVAVWAALDYKMWRLELAMTR